MKKISKKAIREALQEIEEHEIYILERLAAIQAIRMKLLRLLK